MPRCRSAPTAGRRRCVGAAEEAGIRRPRRLAGRRGGVRSGGRSARSSSTSCWRDGATRAVGAGHRARPEEPDEWRTCFERDRDRILHATGVPPAGRQDPGVRVPRRPPAHPPHPRPRGRPGRHVASPGAAASTSRSPRPSRSATTAVTARAATPARTPCRPYVDGGYDHAVWGADVVAGAAQPVRRDARRHPQPLVEPAGAGDARGRGRLVGRPHRLRLPRLRGRRGGRHRRRRHAAGRRRRAVRAGRSPASSARSSAAMVDAAAADRADRHDRADRRRARRVPPLQLRAHLPAAGQPGPGRRRSSTCCGRSSSTTPTAPPAPGAAAGAGGSDAAIAAAVSYVAGMTDRFACRQAVSLLGWDPAKLPAGVT